MKPKITYFAVRGRAEVIRVMFEDLGVEYDERRVGIEEWPAVKASLMFGQLPTYQEGELFIDQSHAIYRYLARKYNLYGDNELQRIRCDIVEEAFVDAQTHIGTFCWRPDFAAQRQAYETQQLPILMEKLQKLLDLNRGGTSWWVGDRVSFVDFLAWHFLEYVRALSPRTLDRFERLKAAKLRLEARPRVAAYLQSSRRPPTLTVSMAPFGGTPETS
jgi:glutathione S-transferase